MAVRRLQQAIDNAQNVVTNPKTMDNKNISKEQVQTSCSKKDVLTTSESSNDNVLKNVDSEKQKNKTSKSSSSTFHYSKDGSQEKKIIESAKWRTFLNLFKPTEEKSENITPDEIAYKKPPGTKMRKFMRNLRKMFRPRNKHAHQNGNKKLNIPYYEPMKSASYLHNAVSFNCNISMVSNINYIRFNSDTSINSSNCSTVLEFDNCITDDEKNLTDNTDSMKDNNDSINKKEHSINRNVAQYESDTDNQVEMWEKVISMTNQKHRLTPLPPPVLLEFDLPLVKTSGVPKRLLITPCRKDADDLLMKQITVEHNRSSMLNQRAGAASRGAQRLQENKLVLEQELLVKQQNIEKSLQKKLKKANDAKTNKLMEKQKVLQVKHDKIHNMQAIRAIINPLDQPRLPPINFPVSMEVPLVIGHRKVAPKPKLTKKVKPKGKAKIDKHALARVKRDEFIENRLRPVSRHNQRVDEIKTRLQPSTSMVEPNQE